jgi:S-(hydroxymethyl)glutathione dehydrogenase/alcohol dehydrogenase
MRTQAAVLWGAGQDWEIQTVELGEPVQHEVRIKLAASGLCHSEEHIVTGDAAYESFPFVGGHEAPASSKLWDPVSRHWRSAITWY